MDSLEQRGNNLGRIVENFRGAFGNIRGERRSPWDFSNQDILPPKVLNELNASGGTLGREGIRNVANTYRYEPTSFYLLVKGLENDPSAQQEVLRQAVKAEARPGSYAEHLRGIVNLNLSLLPKDYRVESAKLFQVSRMGPKLWDEKFAEIADKLRVEHRGREKFVLAYASLIGIQHFARHSRETGEPVNILIENWYQNPANPNCGYVIRADTGRVDLLSRDFSRPADFTLVDDTVATWRHLGGVWGFLTGQDPSTLVIDDSRISVVCKTSTDGSANPCPKPLLNS